MPSAAIRSRFGVGIAAIVAAAVDAHVPVWIMVKR